jgi:hypothetical protein
MDSCSTCTLISDYVAGKPRPRNTNKNIGRIADAGLIVHHGFSSGSGKRNSGMAGISGFGGRCTSGSGITILVSLRALSLLAGQFG